MRESRRPLALALAASALCLAAASQALAREDPHLRRGRVLVRSGKHREGINELQEALRRDNRNAEAHFWIGKAYRHTSEYDRAAEHLEQAIQNDPRREEAYRELGSAYLELSKRKEAKGQPELASEYLQKAEDVGKSLLGREPDEKESYEFLVELAMYRAGIYRRKGELEKSRDQLDQALRYTTRVLEIDPEDVSTYFQRIDILFGQKKYEACEQACNEVLKVNPQLHKPKLTLAKLHQVRGDLDGAIRIYTKMLEQKPTQIQARIERAKLYLELKKYEAALADANEAIRISNKNPYANFIRGAVYMQLKKLDAAVEEFRQASVSIPEESNLKLPAHFWLARCLILKDQTKDAIEELKTVVGLNSRFLPARLILASCHLKQGYPDGAVSVLLDALPFAPENPEVRRLLGIAYLHKGEFDRAKSQFQKILAEDMDQTRAHQVLAAIALSERPPDVDKAVEHCLQALKVEPKNIDVHFLLGFAYLRRNRLNGAKRQFERVLELSGRHPSARMHLATVHERLGEFDLAQEQLQRCIEEDPTQSKPRRQLVSLYIKQRKYDKAEDELSRLLEIEAEKAKVYLAMAELHRAKGEKEKAETFATRALEEDPQLLAAHVFKARMRRNEQRWAAARKELEDALGKDATYAPAYDAAVIYVYLGQYDDAVRLFEKAVSNDVRRISSLIGAATALQLKGDYRGALANISRADELRERRQDADPFITLQTANIYLAQGDAANARTLLRGADHIPQVIRDAYLGLVDKFAADRPRAKRVGDYLTKVMFYGSHHWYDQAEQNCTSLLKLAPDNTFAYNILADVYHRTGDAKKEIETLLRLIDVEPKEPRHRVRLGRLFLDVGRFKDARRAFEQAAEAAPKDPTAHLALADYFYKMAQYDLCTEEAERVLALDEDNGHALAFVASCHLKNRDLAEAKRALQRLVETPSAQKGTLPYLQLAEINRLEGKLDQAVKQYEDAVEHNPQSIPARMGLAQAYLDKNRVQEAIQQLNEVLVLDSIHAPALLRLAKIYRASRRFDKALELAQRAVQIAPSSREARLELAAIHMARGQHDAALEQFRQILKDRPNDVGAKVGMAEVTFQAGDRQAAIKQLTSLLAQQRPLPPAQIALITFYRRLGQVDKAQAELEELVREPSSRLMGAYDLAVVYIHKDRLDDALRLINARLEAQREPGVLLARGTALQLKGQLDAAVDAFAEAQKASSKDARMASFLANAYLAAGKPQEARKAIEAVEVQPELLEAYKALIAQLGNGDAKSRLAANALNQAALYVNASWHTLAEEQYQKLLETLPDNLAVLHFLADVRERMGDAKEALATYQKMVATRPHYEPALRKIAHYHLANSRPEAAAEVYRKLLKDRPEHVGYLLSLATAIQKQGKHQEAIDIYKKVIQLAPNNPIGYNNLAWLYAIETKQLKEAEALATKAADLAPAHTSAGAAVRDTLAWIYYLSERYDEALEHARLAVEGMPGSAEVHYHLGMIFFQRDLRASAVRHLTKALQLDPDFSEKDQIEKMLDRVRTRAP
ncbi:MAG: tetratricopeptide repeat protein [Candidatus Brocadiia bacterium]